MDANGQRFWMLSEAQHWQMQGDEPTALTYDSRRRALRLSRQRREKQFIEDVVLAQQRLQIPPQTVDAQGNRAFVEASGLSIMAGNADTGFNEIFKLADDSEPISDIAMGRDDVLYIAAAGQLIMHDRRERWQTQNVEVAALDDFAVWRLAAEPEGGVWVLDSTQQKLAKLSGMPLHKLAHRQYTADTVSPCQPNPHPPTLHWITGQTWQEGHQAVALSVNQQGELGVLLWSEDNSAQLRIINNAGASTAEVQLSGVQRPYSVAWVDNQQIAILLADDGQEAPVFHMQKKQHSSVPVGDLYPLKKDYNGEPFMHSLTAQVYYPTVAAFRGLHKLSFPFYSKQGEAYNAQLQAPLDSEDVMMVWHRLFIEAVIPQGCGIKVWLAATDEVRSHENILSPDWYLHQFGQVFQAAGRSDMPVACWESRGSEISHHTGFLPCAMQRDKAGLFSVLIQRRTRRVTALQGRYLHVHVQLLGTGRATPEIFALRAYGSRFSYVNEYLPALYQESLFKPQADEIGAATGADFLERYIGNIEGHLTRFEDDIAHAYLLTQPQTVPDPSLGWLASWLGYPLNASLPIDVQRHLLNHAADLYRWHGTLRGLKLALNIVTQGGVSRGNIVVLEDFRLRRTFASIIGADLADAEDALTAGAAISGHANVGDSLFVGDELKQEFMALFAADLQLESSERSAVDALFEKLAHRVTVLVHEGIDQQQLGFITQMLEQEIPAHVKYQIISASSGFLVGMAALVGVDSYLTENVQPGRVTVGASSVGQYDVISGEAALDTHMNPTGAGFPVGDTQPQAKALPVRARFGHSITLDGSESRAFGGRHLSAYAWNYSATGENND